MQDDSDEQKSRRMKTLAGYLSLPFLLGVPPMVGWFIGTWVDQAFGTKPYGMYVLLVFGFAAGVRECYRIIVKNKDVEL